MSIVSRLSKVLRARLATGANETRDTLENGGTRPRGDRVRTVDRELAGLYANLELPYGADLEQVRAAWKRLLRRYHPDLHGSDPERHATATEIVQGLNRAFEKLRRRLEPHHPQQEEPT